MTLPEFKQTLEAAAPGLIYELVAPNGLSEYAVWHSYGPASLIGDDRVQLEVPRVQIDVIWQTDDQLLITVKEALFDMAIPYVVVDYGLDDAWQAMRCILQLEVL